MTVASTPVWLGARIVRADHQTLLRAVISLILGTIGVAVCILLTGLRSQLLAPLLFLLAFKYVLATSFFGAIAYWPLMATQIPPLVATSNSPTLSAA